MITSFKSIRLRAGLIGTALWVAAGASLAAYPDKPVRLVVPFAAGGGTDLIARTLGAGMPAELGQQVIVDNKPGAGTIIGTDAVAKSAPDGYNIVISTFAHAVNPTLQPKLPYAHDKAFTPITLIGKGPNVLVVRADSPYKTVKDVIDAARAKPGKLTYASQEITHAIRQRLRAHGDPPVYLSLDIDCLDPAFAPGTGTPEPAGLGSGQVMTLLEDLVDLNFVGMDCVEVAPAYDHAEITAYAAASFVWTYLAGQVSALHVG